MNDEEETIIDLGDALRNLKKPRFTKYPTGRYIYDEIQSFWEMELTNTQRRWKLLDRKQLNALTLGIGRSVALQFCFLLDPSLNHYEREYLSGAMGFAVKLADNLVDLEEDIQSGFINIPLEDINNLQGIVVDNDKLVSVDRARLKVNNEYIQKELERVRQAYNSADYRFFLVALRRPFWKKELSLLHSIAYSWFKELEKTVA